MMQPRYVRTPYGIECFFTPVRRRKEKKAKLEALAIITVASIILLFL